MGVEAGVPLAPGAHRLEGVTSRRRPFCLPAPGRGAALPPCGRWPAAPAILLPARRIRKSCVFNKKIARGLAKTPMLQLTAQTFAWSYLYVTSETTNRRARARERPQKPN